MADLFKSECNEVSGRCAVIEDNGSSSWLYLTPKGGQGIDKDAFIYSPISPHKTLDRDWIEAGNPPILSEEYASEFAVIKTPDEKEVILEWSEDGESVAVKIRGEVIAMIASGHERGYSKSLVSSSGFGNPWNSRLYNSIFRERL